ncbi:phenylacetic acid degradation bifunctional protein PaaZ [Corynebacterium cystitidis]|uniref:Oxepin-CoA hydrolase / 3-oxo-5,6-dehydrosuberyl-CoA semialdehyde dehydrogenase n=1 Tax=Corynebacterium cystitidis DSM 20524 TaxID=1121357 RepID=A0A1H9TQE5_9CORY|nr:phenylacetic acid degradation bifunctional protein PaaZ [Corynebacterium cystitidis]WJY81996.1 Bifunctional protein PaaZ [Corynebacterium cystitidis DSM 20524]SER99372.1 oxepin-CoA hydrolase / 3-oxo-5,6-dehydrosuberyl-CoA semialdehyde dehydrogenase [Corynebacterium cystitidis DSM 20524]SNV81088.1 bifunctional aldehyde dehydrogenase/enoyl-CoA hydratase [Corynebacterium cystitidis]
MNLVPSFLQGKWISPKNPQRVTEVADSSTGEIVARVSTDGLDFKGAVEYGRTIGQRNLKTLTIHERALKIKELALYLNENKESLYELANKAGANKRDNMVDIDGGISTLFTFSSKGRREMPNSNVVVDGPPEILAKDSSFQGQHIYTALTGVAVQINAFNFPVWGMLEKFAPSFIAGMPTIVKPATPTGYVTAELIRLMDQSGILPEGSVQLISGSAGDLLDHLDYNDHVAFTGSAWTADTLRNSDSVRNNGVRFSAEADSLNAAILGPDATPDTPEFEAYVKLLFVEQTSKAGQKCTAVRRAIVPENLKDDVAQALKKRIDEKVVVGDPRDENSTMGPLVSVEQAHDVKKAVDTLVADGGKVVAGGGDINGAFFPPTILTFDNARSERVHDTEAFGPVVSILGYTDIDDAIELAALGCGSLVASVATNNPETTRKFAEGIAAHHGRLHFIDREDAKTSTGHGSPLPHLVHGGPGRAGGGEELGGVRAIKHYMQRTAIQGSPNHLTAITGEWHTGAQVQRVTREDVDNGAQHPFQKDLATLKIGDQFASPLRKVNLQDILDFAEETGDTFYAHVNEEAAMKNPFFPRRVAHGYLLVAWAAGLFVEGRPGPVLANYGLENLRFVKPVTYDDSIRVELTAKRITPRVTDDYGEVAWDTVLYNQDDEIVAVYDVLTLVEKVSTTYA